MTGAAYTYRNDTTVPAFDDTHPVLVFDGICALCSGGAAHLMQWDHDQKFRFATAQSPLGHALLTHYGCDTVNFNTILLVAHGHGYIKSDAYLETARLLGGWWQIFLAAKIIPHPIRDFVYDWKARNRYRWFGKTDYCALLPVDDSRLLDK